MKTCLRWAKEQAVSSQEKQWLRSTSRRELGHVARWPECSRKIEKTSPVVVRGELKFDPALVVLGQQRWRRRLKRKRVRRWKEGMPLSLSLSLSVFLLQVKWREIWWVNYRLVGLGFPLMLLHYYTSASWAALWTFSLYISPDLEREREREREGEEVVGPTRQLIPGWSELS